MDKGGEVMTFDQAHNKMLEGHPVWQKYVQSIPPAILRYYYLAGQSHPKRKRKALKILAMPETLVYPYPPIVKEKI